MFGSVRLAIFVMLSTAGFGAQQDNPSTESVFASTDASMRAEILSYSRSRGLFAGVSLEGTSLRPDDDASRKVYGRPVSARMPVTGKNVAGLASGAISWPC